MGCDIREQQLIDVREQQLRDGNKSVLRFAKEDIILYCIRAGLCFHCAGDSLNSCNITIKRKRSTANQMLERLGEATTERQFESQERQWEKIILACIWLHETICLHTQLPFSS